MRILCVTNMYPSSRYPALGIFVQQQVQGLREVGIDVDVLYVPRREKGMRCYLGLVPQLRQRLAATMPDLVHVMYGGIMAHLVTGAVSVRPVMVTFQGSDLLGERCAWKRRILSRVAVWASWNAARRATSVVLVSNVLCRALPADVPRSRFKVIPAGIELARFRPLDRRACRAQLGWQHDRFHVLFQDSGDPTKRPQIARAAVANARAGGLDAELHVLRGVPNEQVPIWMNASDVLLLTSEHEGSPTIVKEALACDRPVVSVEVGDVAERLDGIEGCYLAQAEPDDLAVKLLLVSRGPDCVHGREAMAELSVQRVAARLKEFYEETIETWQRHRLETNHQLRLTGV